MSLEPVHRSKAYLDFIRNLPCLVCGSSPCDPHHTTRGGTGLKGSDFDAISLCHKHHVEVHSIGVRTFEERHAIGILEAVKKCLIAYARKMEGK